MERQGKISRTMIEGVRRKFADEAQQEVDEFTKVQAIKELLPDILDMQSRGLRLSKIAAILSETGIVVTTPSLMALLTKAKARVERTHAQTDKRTRTAMNHATTRQGAPQPPAMPKERPGAQTSAETPQQQQRAEGDMGRTISGKSPSTEPAAQTGRGPREQVATHFGFTPRKDSERI